MSKDPLEGLPPVVVDSGGEERKANCDDEFQRALKYLEKYDNKPLADLLRGLTPEARVSLFSDLGGSWFDLQGDTPDIAATEAALNKYVENFKDTSNQGSENRINATNELKATILS